MAKPDKSLITTVYRKPTHTDLYFQLDSHHNLAAKFTVINTLTHRAKTLCSNPQLLKEEEAHLRQALRRCKYPGWAFNWASIQSNRSNRSSNMTRNNTINNINKPHIAVPCIKGLSESCKNIHSKHGIQMHFKGGSTIKNLLSNQRQRYHLEEKGVTFRYMCDRVDCEDEYIEESGRTFAERYKGRTFAERYKEYMKFPSPLHDDHNITGHDIYISKISALWAEKMTIWQDSSKKPS